MAQRLTYRRHTRYNTKSNKQRIVKTPGGKLVFQTAKKTREVAQQLKNAAPEIPIDDTLVVATMLRDLAEDKFTLDMTNKMRAQNEDPQLRDFLNQATPKDIATGLYQITDEIKALELLFQNPQRAVEALNQDGIIPDESKLKFYRETPLQLKEDLTRVLYMSFVAFASKGGYL